MTAATAVLEKQIMFKGPMVQAILERRKKKTRRVIKPVRGFEHHDICRPDMAADSWAVWWHGDGTDLVGCLQECPYGKPGDRLWVREGLYRPDGEPWLYRADDQPVMVDPASTTAMLTWAHHKQQDYCPSIFMPRFASRITLEVTEVRAERLQDITEEDARAEGIQRQLLPDLKGNRFHWGDKAHDRCPTAVAAFRALWDSINKKRGIGWDVNPWVWVIGFEQVAR